MHIIDRRKNQKGKSLTNRQRFIKRAKKQIKEAIKDSIQKRSLEDLKNGEKINIPRKNINEPHFRHDHKQGKKDLVNPGNKDFVEGDRIKKPESSQGGGQGKEGSNDPAVGEDDFEFVLTKDEFYDLFFEDLELPNLIKKQLSDSETVSWQREGFRTTGNPATLDVPMSFKKSLSRRLALKRPKNKEIKELETKILELKENGDEQQELEILEKRLLELKKAQKRIPFFDYTDMRYKNFNPKPSPNTKAVMVCIMDVSGSMGEHEKDISKRFFMLLYMFLTRKYDKVDLVFIRHHTEAKEVDEQEFFYSRETGGTIVSNALELMDQILKERYPRDEWNIYGAQCSDGENWSRDDSEHCVELLEQKLLPILQYYAYIEIKDSDMPLWQSSDSGLWGYYKKLEKFQNFAMKAVSERSEIWTVFRELFKKENVQ